MITGHTPSSAVATLSPSVPSSLIGNDTIFCESWLPQSSRRPTGTCAGRRRRTAPPARGSAPAGGVDGEGDDGAVGARRGVHHAAVGARGDVRAASGARGSASRRRREDLRRRRGRPAAPSQLHVTMYPSSSQRTKAHWPDGCHARWRGPAPGQSEVAVGVGGADERAARACGGEARGRRSAQELRAGRRRAENCAPKNCAQNCAANSHHRTRRPRRGRRRGRSSAPTAPSGRA